MNDDELSIRVTESANKIIEHCDCVVVLASVQDGDSEISRLTYSYRGPFHSALGLMEEFKARQLHKTILDPE